MSASFPTSWAGSYSQGWSAAHFRAQLCDKGKEHPIRSSRMLYPKFFHVRMSRRVNEIGMRTGKTRADFLKQDHFGVYVKLFSLGEAIPPVRKFVGKFDLSFHGRNTAYELCFVNGV